MKKWKLILNVLIIYMMIGGVMGIVKGIVPNMTWFNYRYLMGLGSVFTENDMPSYAVVYGVVMAILELLVGILLLKKSKMGLKFAFVIVSINALACLVAVVIGDMCALASFAVRLFGLFVLYKMKNEYI